MAGAVVSAVVLALTPVASGTSALPTLNVALQGTKGIVVSGSEVSGAVSVVSSITGRSHGAYGLVRLNPNEPPAVAIAQGFGAVQSHGGNENALTATGDAIVVSADAPSTVQTVLTPGTWVALNISGMGQPGFTVFNVSQSATPAALPAAAATEKSIEFGFRGSRVLHQGTMVRARNGGYLVHMIDLIGVRSKAAGNALIARFRAGFVSRRAARPFLNGVFIDLLNPASPGALQQQVLHAPRGWYVEACFMNTQDGREHTQLRMDRLVRVVR
jgi:hypothetical protein